MSANFDAYDDLVKNAETAMQYDNELRHEYLDVVLETLLEQIQNDTRVPQKICDVIKQVLSKRESVSEGFWFA